MYRILTFGNPDGLGFTWAVADFEFDCLEDAMAGVNSIPNHGPWRIQEWIDVRNGPAEAGFWRDAAYWLDGCEYRVTTERMT